MGIRDTDARLHREEDTVFVILGNHMVVDCAFDPGIFHGCFDDLRGDLLHLVGLALAFALAEALDDTGDPGDRGDRIVVRGSCSQE